MNNNKKQQAANQFGTIEWKGRRKLNYHISSGFHSTILMGHIQFERILIATHSIWLSLAT